MPGTFRFPSDRPAAVWTIHTLSPRPRGHHTACLPLAELNDITAQVTARYPSSQDMVAVVMPMKEWMVRIISRALLLLLAGIGLCF